MRGGIGALLSERGRISREMEGAVDLASGERLSFADLDARSSAIASALADLVAPGERIALLAGNSHHYAAIVFAAAKLGAILVPLNWRLTVPELAHQLEDCEPAVAIHDQANEHAARELAKSGGAGRWVALETLVEAAAGDGNPVDRRVGPDDGFLILYTSGTTGRPKGALHTHGSSLAWCASTIASFDNRYGDRQLLVAPLFHIAGICVLLNAIHRGFTLVIAPGFDAGKVWETIEVERITSMFAVPTMINDMRAHGNASRFSHETLRWIMCGAAPVPVTLIDIYAGLGIDIHQVYGSTESHGGIAVLPPAYAHSRKGSTGLPCFGVELKVVDAAGRDLGPGERGELVTRGPHLFKAYWRQPAETARSFQDGWFMLGDIGETDEDGFITIRDRSKDMIISGGENVYPAEIENVLMRSGKVREVAVVGRPDERWGEVPVAVVVPNGGDACLPEVVRDELSELASTSLARYKRPAEYMFVDSLPRNAAGKVQKHIIRSLLV